MEPTQSCLHPNPGWRNLKPIKVNWTQSTSETGKIVGKHCILELYECDQVKINDEAFLRTIITTAAKRAGAKLLNLITHRFEPQGVTGLALLAESHLSIHTWPEIGYAAVDVFTCGDHTLPEMACEFLRKELGAKGSSLKSFQRESPEEILNLVREPIEVKNEKSKL